jgi:anti-sigma factor RsiW
MLEYTTEDLLLYLYGETSVEQAGAISEALKADWELQEKLDVLKQSMDILDSLIESPRPESVQAILAYAGISAPIEQQQ